MTDGTREPIITPQMIAAGLGAFDDLDYLGGGTYADTYRAVRDDDEFAIKVIHRTDMPEHLWERELQALARVDHPNVMRMIDSGRMRVDDSTYPYLRCEFIAGGDVRHRIEIGDLLREPSAIRAFLTGLLAGVAEIHDLGILHRDIKPANVALRDGRWDRPVILDFGLARVLDMSSHTELPALIGTVRYMAPEQLKGHSARRRSDLFAVAAVTYEAITGRHPYATSDTATAQELHDRIQATPPNDPREFQPDCPGSVAKVLVRLLSYWAHERLGVGAALRDLEEKP